MSGKGVPGYVTPKTAVGAVVGNEAGEILLVQRAGTGVWLYPTGWADIGYSPSEVAIKEVEEETGIEVEPVALMAVFDGMRLGFHSIPLYSLIFHCRMTGGALKPHPLECLDVGFFGRDNLPEPLAGSGLWVDMAFEAIEGARTKTFFDLPREPTWRARSRRRLPEATRGQPPSCRMSRSMMETAPRVRSHSSPMAVWSTSPVASGATPSSGVTAAASVPGSMSSP